jgi:hypothetical protein
MHGVKSRGFAVIPGTVIPGTVIPGIIPGRG